MSTPAKALARLVWLPWLAVLLLLVALTVFTLRVNAGTADRRTCKENLQQIHAALVDYALHNGTLPTLDLYPSNPRSDGDSLLVALSGYGVSPDACHCPRCPDSIGRNQGLSYLWNVELNGKSLDEVPGDEWMVIEITALSPTLKAPHFGKYNVLLVNKDIEERRNVPEIIRVERSGK